jgi:dihydroneopterin aldolase
LDTIRIHGLALDCIVGLRPEERVAAQRLLVDIALGVDTREAGRTGRIRATLDYDRIAKDVVALLEFRRYRLLEVAAEELSLMLLSAYPTALWVELTLEKPGALAGRARAASIEVRRTRQDLGALVGDVPGTPLRTEDAELSVLELAPGQSLPKVDRGSRVIDRVLTGQLYGDDGTLWIAGLPCPSDVERDWRANGSEVRVLRCVVRSH